ncbi:hypothetical protein D3C81_1646140 [compost metagenome]
MGELVGATVQLGVTQTQFTGHHGIRVWRAQHLRLEASMNSLLKIVGDSGCVQIDQQMLTLIVRQQRYLLQHRLIVADHRLQQALEVADVTLNSRLIEQGNGVLQHTANAVRRICQRQ